MFAQVIGQTETKRHLLEEARAGRLPHALMLCGPAGSGKLALAISLAQWLLCRQPAEGDACGECPACRLSMRFAHPDLHFVFPVARCKTAEHSVSDTYLDAWRKRLENGLYFDLEDWTADMGGTGGQPLIYAAEAAQIGRKLALKPAMGGRKVMVIWLPERMNAECANKLLKLLEEPPEKTHFLMASNEPEKILPTILSRTQCIEVKGVETADMAAALAQTCPGRDTATAIRAARGNFTAALKLLDTRRDQGLFLDLFILLMRLSYQRKIKEMRAWSEQMAAMGRERQKDFLDYCQRMTRESFAYNFRLPALCGMTAEEEAFTRNFARFVNERNVQSIMEELETAQRDIGQNVNAKFVFFDLALKMAVLLIQ